MCVCESDLVKMKLHLITRRYYPGIKYNEQALGRVAEDLGIRYEKSIRNLPPAEQADLAATVYHCLPESTGPSRQGALAQAQRARGQKTEA
jgi:transposase